MEFKMGEGEGCGLTIIGPETFGIGMDLDRGKLFVCKWLKERLMYDCVGLNISGAETCGPSDGSRRRV